MGEPHVTSMFWLCMWRFELIQSLVPNQLNRWQMVFLNFFFHNVFSLQILGIFPDVRPTLFAVDVSVYSQVFCPSVIPCFLLSFFLLSFRQHGLFYFSSFVGAEMDPFGFKISKWTKNSKLWPVLSNYKFKGFDQSTCEDTYWVETLMNPKRNCSTLSIIQQPKMV